MTFWHGFVVLTLIHLLAAASPGPDFALVTRESLVRGRSAGVLTSVGIALGLGVHIAYSAAGIVALVAHSAFALNAIKIAGAIYLLYLGLSALQAQNADTEASISEAAKNSGSRPIIRGFFCNLLNPKAPLYFLALLTSVVPATTPASTLAVYGLWLVVMQWLWFTLVALLFSHARIRSTLHSARRWIDRLFGLAMIAIAVRLLWSAIASFTGDS